MVKISQFAVLAATCALAYSASATQFNLEQQLDFRIFTDEKIVKYYMSCVRGFADGYAQGLYGNREERVPKTCLDENTYKNYIDLNKFLASGNILEIFKSIGKFYQIGFDI